MTENSQKTIREEILKLPKENQDAINAIDWVFIAEGIGKKFLLIDEEINKLQVVIGVALCGLINQDRFTFEVANIGMSNEEARSLVLMATEKIFTPIGNKIENVLKNKLKSQTPKWEQRVNFILSGGNYSAFLDK